MAAPPSHSQDIGSYAGMYGQEVLHTWHRGGTSPHILVACQGLLPGLPQIPFRQHPCQIHTLGTQLRPRCELPHNLGYIVAK